MDTCASFADSRASTVCQYEFAACSCSMAMAQFHEIFLPVLRRSADGRERTIVVRHAPIADNVRLADRARPGFLTRRRAIA